MLLHTLLMLEIKNAVQPYQVSEKNTESAKLFFQAKITGLEFRHKEDKYTDFIRELLVPHSLSAEGPALAAGDVNGDGLDDLFIGGAKGQAAGF